MMKKKEKVSGIIYNENKGWKAQLILSNNDKYYTVYFDNYNEAAEEYNRVLQELKMKCGLRKMLRWGLPTKLLKINEDNKKMDNEKKEIMPKKTRSGKNY